jgi:hypothetical protein
MAKGRSTDDWIMTSYVGIGPVRFGMSRGDVRIVVASRPTAVKRTPDAKQTSDVFTLGPHTLHVHYDDQDRCEVLEISGAGLGGPQLKGRGFLNRPLDRASVWLRQRDPELIDKQGRVKSKKLGLALYAPQSTIQSFAAFSRDYGTRLAS